MWWIIAIVLIATAGSFAGDYLKHKRKLEQIRLDSMDKQLELERLKQENFLLENRHMQSELERIREENRLLLEQKNKQKNSPWLINETEEKED